jgi:hypothetical protein
MAKDKADPKETAVRDAASALSKAILDARAAGYAVTWPSRVEDLDSMQISETGAMRDGDQAAGLTPVIAQGVVVGDQPLEPQA